MARSYILGGVAATGLATGVPYMRRITRLRGDASQARADGLTCAVVGGAIRFDGANGQSVNWTAGAAQNGGELLFVEFPSTAQTITVELEETMIAGVRLKVMLTAEGQVVNALDNRGVRTGTDGDGDGTPDIPLQTDTMNPLTNGNFIEITAGNAATINARTKGIFILIQKYATAGADGNNLIAAADPASGPPTLQQGAAGIPGDGCNILVTAVLDHEGLQGSNGVDTARFDAAGNESSLRKLWPMSVNGSDGVG